MKLVALLVALAGGAASVVWARRRHRDDGEVWAQVTDAPDLR